LAECHALAAGDVLSQTGLAIAVAAAIVLVVVASLIGGASSSSKR
jgi:hypothetical protein